MKGRTPYVAARLAVLSATEESVPSMPAWEPGKQAAMPKGALKDERFHGKVLGDDWMVLEGGEAGLGLGAELFIAQRGPRVPSPAQMCMLLKEI